jgi:ATP-binding cassette subfamily C (CFTR/MRP) protein 1
MFVGSIGCGKSIFLKALLGEVPLFHGEIFCKYPDVAICDQTSWIIIVMIQSVIKAPPSRIILTTSGIPPLFIPVL